MATLLRSCNVCIASPAGLDADHPHLRCRLAAAGLAVCTLVVLAVVLAVCTLAVLAVVLAVCTLVVLAVVRLSQHRIPP